MNSEGIFHPFVLTRMFEKLKLIEWNEVVVEFPKTILINPNIYYFIVYTKSVVSLISNLICKVLLNKLYQWETFKMNGKLWTLYFTLYCWINLFWVKKSKNRSAQHFGKYQIVRCLDHLSWLERWTWDNSLIYRSF